MTAWRDTAETADPGAANGPGHGCYMQQAFAAIRAHPIRFLAVLAAFACLILLGAVAAQLLPACLPAVSCFPEEIMCIHAHLVLLKLPVLLMWYTLSMR